MRKDTVILIVEDDDGHAALVKKNLARAGITNDLLHFKDGQKILDFLFLKDEALQRTAGTCYVMLLDIRMPKIDGFEVLEKVKADPELRKIPVVMLTTTDDAREVDRCHSMGCSHYITKPVDYESFVNSVRQLGLFLQVIEVPRIY